jgi:hypothetical protein
VVIKKLDPDSDSPKSLNPNPGSMNEYFRKTGTLSTVKAAGIDPYKS